MGDQIKRYCEKMEPEEFEDILDNEARVAEGEVFDTDPNCMSTKDRGREVKVCRSGTWTLPGGELLSYTHLQVLHGQV